MATPLNLPFPPLVEIVADGPMTWAKLSGMIANRLGMGVSFVVLRKDGPANRGGYFFHLKQTGNQYTFATFDRTSVCEFKSGEECARFINHVAGLRYDPEMWEVAQVVNLRSDEDTD